MSKKGKEKDQDEAAQTIGQRRASLPTSSQLIPTHGYPAFSTSLQVPLPLPYLPSDYMPSPTSPKQFLLSPPSTLPLPHQGSRQRSRSTGMHQALPPPDQPSDLSSSSAKQHYELVPYREWTVILRNDDSGDMVLYNQEQRQITVQHYLPAPPTSQSNTDGTDECPLCHRPFSPTHRPFRNTNTPTFMDRNYFRLLGTTPLTSPTSSNHATPNTTQGSPPPMTGSYMHLNADAINQGYYAKFFKQIKKLGRGFRGSVFLCEHVLDGVNLGKYAVKKVAVGNNHPWLVKMLREVHLLERLHHPNIVSYKHSWLEYDRLTPFGPKVPCLFILMECANGGNLEEYLEPEMMEAASPHPVDQPQKSAKDLKRERIKRQLQQQKEFEAEAAHQDPARVQKRLLNIGEISSLFLDIVHGLAHLHQQNIVHRDLKPPNLLLKWDDRRGSGVFQIPCVLISDFGECEDLEGLPDSDRTGATGTLEFMAPEHVRLDAQGKNTVEYTSKADMWSLGMVLYYLCYSCLPYTHIQDVDLLREEILAFREIKFPRSRLDGIQDKSLYHQPVAEIPQEFKLLIRLLLSADPAKRPSCQEILSKLDQVPFDQERFTLDTDTPASRTPASASSSSASISSKSSGSFMNSSLSAAAIVDRRRSSTFHLPVGPVAASHLQYNVQREPSPPASMHPPTLLPTDIDTDMDRYDELEEQETQPSSTSTAAAHQPLKRRSSSTKSEATISTNGLRKRQRYGSYQADTPPLLLPSPAAINFSDQIPFYQGDMMYLHLLKTVTLLFKIGSCAYPCFPYSPKSFIFYPVIVLAVTDLWCSKLTHSLLLLTIHLVWLISLALLSNGMCMSSL
ncbi:kinase-like protein [Hesseltinella vesiculosa]|uniref:non-specific serine/threonine protein kinase n=1 Tax=Hesseltinella vesiculosa TaxID=101127 RepID=A0A1X2G9W6_9FUNG|nr:kinase-like protein [Hesseltinella vesiculosa]